MKRFIAALVAGVVVLVAGHGPSPAQPAQRANPLLLAYNGSVYLTGDSLTWRTAPYLQYLFDLSGRELQVKAYPGVTIPEALPWSQAEVAAGPMPPVAVVALGANDTEPSYASSNGLARRAGWVGEGPCPVTNTTTPTMRAAMNRFMPYQMPFAGRVVP